VPREQKRDTSRDRNAAARLPKFHQHRHGYLILTLNPVSREEVRINLAIWIYRIYRVSSRLTTRMAFQLSLLAKLLIRSRSGEQSSISLAFLESPKLVTSHDRLMASRDKGSLCFAISAIETQYDSAMLRVNLVTIPTGFIRL